jgi:hypothetical protein
MENFYFSSPHKKSMARHSMKHCPRCLLAHWKSGGQTRIRYIPEFMELCRDCCDPGEVELRDKEKGPFSEFVQKDRDEQTRKKICCENSIFLRDLSDSFF